MKNIDIEDTMRSFWSNRVGKIIIISGSSIILFYLSGKLMRLTSTVVSEYKSLKQVIQN